jgi:hypothetical protein
MATRMQQRRGTAAQWTAANPILAAGEIGFESDTGEFRVGDGVNTWSTLSPFKNLDDLGGSLDDYIPLTQKNSANGVATLDVNGAIPMAQLANIINNAPSALDTLKELGDALGNVGGLIDTAKSEAISTAAAAAEQYADDKDTLRLADAKSYADGIVATAITTAENAAATDAASKVSTHAAVTTSVHGIADTAALATKTGIETLTNKTISAADNTVTVNLADVVDVTATVAEVNKLAGLSTTKVELGYVAGATSAIQTQIDTKAAKANPTFTGTVNAAEIVLSGNLTVNGTTTTINATNLTVDDPLIYVGESNSANSVDLGVVASFNDGTYQHSGIVRDATDNKWKLFRGVTDEPTTTVNFAQATYETLVVGGIEFADGAQVKQGVPSLTTINQQAGAYTPVLADRDKLVEVSSASGVTVTIPTNASVAYPVGTSIDILQTGSGQITIAGAGGVTVNATPGLKLRTQWSSATLFKRATDTWVVFGDLTA